MKDLSVKYTNTKYVYTSGMKNIVKVMTKELIRAGTGRGVVGIPGLIIEKRIFNGLIPTDQTEKYSVTDIVVQDETIYFKVNGETVLWTDLPDETKLEIYKYLSFKRILK